MSHNTSGVPNANGQTWQKARRVCAAVAAVWLITQSWCSAQTATPIDLTPTPSASETPRIPGLACEEVTPALVKDIAADLLPVSPVVGVSGVAFFAAADPDHGVELWRSD